jgi:hypothetical protein
MTRSEEHKVQDLAKFLKKYSGNNKKVVEIVTVLECSIIADRTIRRMQGLYPDFADIIDKSFEVLTPTEPLMDKSPELYEAHCKELIVRRISGENIKSATDAEIIAALSDLSLKAPLKRDCVYVMQKLFSKLFPDQLQGLPEIQESHEGSHFNVEMELRRNLADLR